MGNLLSSWSALRKQFYPLGYVQKAMMDWKSFRQGKGQSVQNFTEEFRKKALDLNISLYSLDTLLKYIGSLHHYLRHTLLLLNPTSVDEASVQDTHLESRGKHLQEDRQKKPFKHNNNHKFKEKDKSKKTATAKKEGGKLHCKHCGNDGHNEESCWKLHPEQRPKNYGGKKKKKTVAIAQQYLGSDSGDETRITAVGMQGNKNPHTGSSSTHVSK